MTLRNNLPNLALLIKRSVLLNCFLSLLFISGFACSKSDQAETDESIFDLNGDGKSDIRYEYFEGGYYELIDRNFDSVFDESYKYDDKDRLISSRTDDNLDGIPESYHHYVNGILCCSWVDSDVNGQMDLYFEYHHGVLKFAEKYYSGNPSYIGTTTFEFGYPSLKEIKVKVKLSEKQFLDKTRKNQRIAEGVIEYTKEKKK